MANQSLGADLTLKHLKSEIYKVKKETNCFRVPLKHYVVATDNFFKSVQEFLYDIMLAIEADR